jgi:CspA family cold shock protein
MKHTGNVKWLNSAKGFGFITPNVLEGDVFFSMMEVLEEDRVNVKPGAGIEYDVVSSDHGEVAVNIRIV